MPAQVSNKFTQWELTAVEFKYASSFNDLQRKFIQNEIARAALEKVALTYDAQNPLLFAQREAELQGQIEILEYLLSQQSEVNFDSQSSEGEQ